MPVGGAHVTGRDAAVAAFRYSPNFREGRVSWDSRPRRHLGRRPAWLHLRLSHPDRRRSGAANRKYLAYWIRRPAGWRVVAYRQQPRAPARSRPRCCRPRSPPSPRARPAAWPGSRRHRASLHAAEQAFSDRAQIVGLRAAFREYGRADAMNMGGPGPIQIGLDAVTAGFPEGETVSPVSWGTARSFVASSGDLGVSIGVIRGNAPAAAASPHASPSSPSGAATGPARPGATSRSDGPKRRPTARPQDKPRRQNTPAARARSAAKPVPQPPSRRTATAEPRPPSRDRRTVAEPPNPRTPASPRRTEYSRQPPSVQVNQSLVL